MGKKKVKDPLKKAALQAKKEAKADKAARKRVQKDAKQAGTGSGEAVDESIDDGSALDDILETYRQKDLAVKSTLLEPLEDGMKFPLPRANATLTLCEDSKLGHVYLFGGEIYDGIENIVLDELLRWDITKNEWRRLTTPMPRPGPRCAHTTVYYRNALYVLGGELASADQYHHYKDMWRFDLTTLKWEEIVPASSLGTVPSARSGHVAFVWKQFMVVFGGFYEALRDTRWYNDVYVMNLQTLTWMDVPHSKLASRPEPRSACNVGVCGDVALIHGGFSKLPKSSVAPETMSKETKVHTDAWLLHLKPILQGKPPTWERLSSRKLTSVLYMNHRSGTASATYKNRMLVYGGVVDTEQHHHQVDSIFYNDLFAFDMERRKWYPIRVKNPTAGTGKSRRRRKKDGWDGGVEDVANEVARLQVAEEGTHDSESSDLDDDEIENGVGDSSGWGLAMLRSSMFSFVDGNGNTVYEKIHEEQKAGYEADTGGADETKKEEQGQDCVEEDEEKEEEKDGPEAKSSKIDTVASHNHETGKEMEERDRHVLPPTTVVEKSDGIGTPKAVARSEPLPRINSSIVVRNNILYVYGGLLEVGNREVTLDDCWAFDLRRREKWECLWEGTMHKQVWRGAAFDDEDSYISTEQGGDVDSDSSGEGESGNEVVSEAKTVSNISKKDKSRRAGLRQEIAELQEKLELDDHNFTPKMGEVVADFYARTTEYWNAQAAQRFTEGVEGMSESEELTSKKIKREGFNLANARYGELLPTLERLTELDIQLQEEEEARKARKQEKAAKESRRTNRRSR